MKVLKILLALAFLFLSLWTAFSFYKLLFFQVGTIGLGWTLSTIMNRLLVIVLFSIALTFLFKTFQRTVNLRYIWIFLIALLPGFGISFVVPIYEGDYGNYSDEMQLPSVAELTALSGGSFEFRNERILVAFFTSGCPHCKSISRKLGINQKRGQKIDIHVFIPGEISQMDKFIAENNGQKFKQHPVVNDDQFVALSGGFFPSVFLIDPNGKTVKHWRGDMINYTALDELYRLEKK